MLLHDDHVYSDSPNKIDITAIIYTRLNKKLYI